MRNLLFVILFAATSCFALDYTLPKALITSAVDITSVWADVGSRVLNPALNGDGVFNKLGLKIALDINDASDPRLRILYSDSATGTEYNYLIKTVTASSISLENSYYEWNVDADNPCVFEIPILPFKYMQVQTSAGTEGSTKGQLDSLEYYFIKE